MTRTTATMLVVMGVVLAGCSDTGEVTSPDPTTTVASAPSSVAIAPTTTAVAITAPPTTLPDPTIFNSTHVGNLLDVASFVLTVVHSQTINGQASKMTTTTHYIKDPLSAYHVIQTDGYPADAVYMGGGRTYEDNGGYWYLYEKGSLQTPDVLYDVNNFSTVYGVGTAVFDGEAEFAGVPAYHFTFDQPHPESGTTFVGDFYLAQQGNYVVYAHSTAVTKTEGYESTDEITETLSEVNQLTDVALPDDMVPLKDALDLGIALGIPMPADGVIDSLINYNQGGIGVYYYQFTSTWKNEAEFLNFYANLQPTNGWTVTYVGQVQDLDVFCGDGNCVIVNNGDKQVILYFDGSNLHADFDREHQFKPCRQPVSPTACG